MGMYQNQFCYIWGDEHPLPVIWGSLGYQGFDSYPNISSNDVFCWMDGWISGPGDCRPDPSVGERVTSQQGSTTVILTRDMPSKWIWVNLITTSLFSRTLESC